MSKRNLVFAIAIGLSSGGPRCAFGQPLYSVAGTVALKGPGHALRFDGGGALLRVPRTPILEPPELTIELWAKLEGRQSPNARFIRKVGTADRSGYIFSASQAGDPRVQFRFSV